MVIRTCRHASRLDFSSFLFRPPVPQPSWVDAWVGIRAQNRNTQIILLIGFETQNPDRLTEARGDTQGTYCVVQAMEAHIRDEADACKAVRASMVEVSTYAFAKWKHPVKNRAVCFEWHDTDGACYLILCPKPDQPGR